MSFVFSPFSAQCRVDERATEIEPIYLPIDKVTALNSHVTLFSRYIANGLAIYEIVTFLPLQLLSAAISTLEKHHSKVEYFES